MAVNFRGIADENFNKKVSQQQTKRRREVVIAPIAAYDIREVNKKSESDTFTKVVNGTVGLGAGAVVAAGLRYGHLNEKFGKFGEIYGDGFKNTTRKLADRIGEKVADWVSNVKEYSGKPLTEKELQSKVSHYKRSISNRTYKLNSINDKIDELMAKDMEPRVKNAAEQYLKDSDELIKVNKSFIDAKFAYKKDKGSAEKKAAYAEAEKTLTKTKEELAKKDTTQLLYENNPELARTIDNKIETSTKKYNYENGLEFYQSTSSNAA